jgi:hypothetical protein
LSNASKKPMLIGMSRNHLYPDEVKFSNHAMMPLPVLSSFGKVISEKMYMSAFRGMVEQLK